MQYGIFDNSTDRYLAEDGTWIDFDYDTTIQTVDRKVDLFRDDDKAIAKVRQLREANPDADLTLHGFDFERVYFVKEVDNSVLEKLNAPS